MRALVLLSHIFQDAGPHHLDDLLQAQTVSQALRELGHEVEQFRLGLDLERAKDAIRAMSPELAFNLVESVDGKGNLIHLGPALLESLGLPYTGCPAEALMVCSNKVMAKRILLRAGLPTPRWGTREERSLWSLVGHTVILKSVWEHSSTGLDETAVIRPTDVTVLQRELAARETMLGGACFAELYVDGREFNVSILEGPEGPEVLPIAEILFQGYESGKPRIVSYKAKWEPNSMEYINTPRCFDFQGRETLGPLLEEFALECWDLFGLRGYARVDFRVDDQGRPWILEVNPNPCISPDAGFLASAREAGLDSREVVKRILEACSVPSKPPHRSKTRRRASTAHGIPTDSLVFRETIRPEDVSRVREIVRSTGLFTQEEMEVAVELAKEAVRRGEASGYHFLFCDLNEVPVGYACFGPVPCTGSSFDLYWIAVHRGFQNRGLGRKLLARVETLVQHMGGTRLYVETSSRAHYRASLEFYLDLGYRREAFLRDFYSDGDHKLILVKELREPSGPLDPP